MSGQSKLDIIADYFIEKNNREKKGLSNKKLQKLLYYSQAWNLVFNKEKLFKEDIEAWMHGPAIPRIYVKFKDFGFNNISLKVNTSEFKSLSESEKKILDAVWEIYGDLDGNYLEALTHSEKPWIEARNNIAPYESSHNVISLKTMQNYYGQKLKATKS